MNSRLPFIFLVFVLLAVGVSSIYYRHVHNGVPLTSGQRIDIWQVEAEITFTGTEQPATVTFNLPRDNQS